MTFVHDDPDLVPLLRLVERETGIDAALVEKDHWITHSLWALHENGLAVWFKGGTSLSKGFALIERFSEDLDAKGWIKRYADFVAAWLDAMDGLRAGLADFDLPDGGFLRPVVRSLVVGPAPG